MKVLKREKNQGKGRRVDEGEEEERRGATMDEGCMYTVQFGTWHMYQEL